MQFEVYRYDSIVSPNRKDMFILHEDYWDDFGYKTTFDAYYYDNDGMKLSLGSVGIGIKGMGKGRVVQHLPSSFETLSDEFFSLGNSEKYYQEIASLGKSTYEKIYKSLRDMAYDLLIFETNIIEPVVKTSFLRGRSAFNVRSQLSRISKGGVLLTPYNFQYTSPEQSDENAFTSISLNFNVVPESNPPTNVHVIIGRNGTGKTRLIQNMIKSLQTSDNKFGTYIDLSNINNPNMKLFANVLCVAFSPFDELSLLKEKDDDNLPFSYIGLDKRSSDLISNIKDKFIKSFENCMVAPCKQDRWKKTINILSSDPGFDESNIMTYVKIWSDDVADEKSAAKKSIAMIFNKLSSGHKITLLIITACVDKLEEKSIVFLDEPENHLHPPLLSAFVRALSYLLINRNGVSIISTHSPVVLQEVPKSCVWTLRRTNTILITERLETETFGASISALTSEVFGLEVTTSGFHRMIKDVVYNNVNDSYDDISNKFGDQLGNEAQVLLRTLIALRDKGGSSN